MGALSFTLLPMAISRIGRGQVLNSGGCFNDTEKGNLLLCERKIEHRRSLARLEGYQEWPLFSYEKHDGDDVGGSIRLFLRVGRRALQHLKERRIDSDGIDEI